MNPTPEALRIAEAIESGYGTEIRRLHEINGELLKALKVCQHALRQLSFKDGVIDHALERAFAASAKAEGEKA